MSKRKTRSTTPQPILPVSEEDRTVNGHAIPAKRIASPGQIKTMATRVDDGIWNSLLRASRELSTESITISVQVLNAYLLTQVVAGELTVSPEGVQAYAAERQAAARAARASTSAANAMAQMVAQGWTLDEETGHLVPPAESPAEAAA